MAHPLKAFSSSHSWSQFPLTVTARKLALCHRPHMSRVLCSLHWTPVRMESLCWRADKVLTRYFLPEARLPSCPGEWDEKTPKSRETQGRELISSSPQLVVPDVPLLFSGTLLLWFLLPFPGRPTLYFKSQFLNCSALLFSLILHLRSSSNLVWARV